MLSFGTALAEHPDRMELCQRILAVPFKRARSRSIEYLEFDEIQAVLTTIDRNTVDGRRDYALLATMFNTGARVQEIVSLRIGDVRFDKPPQVRLFGKGRKERICPLSPQTAEMFREFLAETRRRGPCRVTHCSVVAMVPCSPVRCSLYPEETLRARSSCETHARRASACTPTACATAPRYICCGRVSTYSRSANGWATPVSPPPTATPRSILRRSERPSKRLRRSNMLMTVERSCGERTLLF